MGEGLACSLQLGLVNLYKSYMYVYYYTCIIIQSCVYALYNIFL